MPNSPTERLVFLDAAADQLLAPSRARNLVLSDWPSAVMCAATALALVVGFSVVIGIVLLFAATPSNPDLGAGAAFGSALAFAMFGATTSVGVGSGTHAFGAHIACLAWPWVMAPAAALLMAERAVAGRFGFDNRRAGAHAFKAALLLPALAAVAASQLSAHSAMSGDGFAMSIRPGTLIASGLVLTVLPTMGRIALRSRAGLSLLGLRDPTTLVRASLRCGCRALGTLLALSMAVAVPTTTVLSSRSPNGAARERSQLLAAAPVLGGNAAADTAIIALGADLGLTRDDRASTPVNIRQLAFPPAAPRRSRFAWALLALPMIAVSESAWRHLRRLAPRRASEAVALGCFGGGVFAIAVLLMALLARVDVTTFSTLRVRNGSLVTEAHFASLAAHAFAFGIGVGLLSALTFCLTVVSRQKAEAERAPS